MSGPRVTDHALLRFLDRAGGLDVEGLRTQLTRSLAKAHEAATDIGGGDYLILSGQLVFVVRAGVVTTVSRDNGKPGRRGREGGLLLDHRGKP